MPTAATLHNPVPLLSSCVFATTCRAVQDAVATFVKELRQALCAQHQAAFILFFPLPQVVYEAVATFVKELRAGGPMRSGAAQPKAVPAKPVDAAASEAAPSGASGAAGAANGAAAAAVDQQAEKAAAAAAKEEAKAASSGHSIELKERFFAGAAGRQRFCEQSWQLNCICWCQPALRGLLHRL